MKDPIGWVLVIALFLLCSSNDLRLTLGSLVVFAVAAWQWVRRPAGG